MLAAVVAELRRWVGSRVQKIWQPDPESVVLELYHPVENADEGRVSWLWIAWDAEFTRAYLSPRKPPTMREPPAFTMALRARIQDARLIDVRQKNFDRILTLDFDGHTLIAELMGKHANAILVGPDGRVISAGKMVGPTKSVRPVLSGQPYAAPPHTDRPSLMKAGPGDDLSDFQGASPFLRKLLESGVNLSEVQEAVQTSRFSPVFVPEFGAYPLSVAALGYPEVARSSISVALANYYDVAIPASRLERKRATLLAQLRRVELARETALADLLGAQDAAARANVRQRMGELILAYQGQIREGDRELKAYDYDGAALSIPLDPERSPVQNANAYFEKAKRAKARGGYVVEQLARQRSDLEGVRSLIARVEAATRLDDVEDAAAEAHKRRWLISQRVPVEKEDRPFQGKRVRELLGPMGWTILVGENAEANDYLTLRVAKPDDWWLHVRGAVSAHVVIPTRRLPDKVPHEVMLFAARLAVKHSNQKHASYVPVDYTLRRYVRKIKSAPPGTVLYTHEKTLHVDPKES